MTVVGIDKRNSTFLRVDTENSNSGLWKTVTSEESVYYIAFALFTLSRVFERSGLSTVFFVDRIQLCRVLLVGCGALLIIKLMFQRYSPKQALFLLAVGCVVILCSINSRSEELAFLFAFIACGQKIKVERLAFVSLICCSVALLYICGLSVFEFTGDTLFTRPDGTVRYAFGFRGPNYFGSTLLQLCCAVSVLCYRNNRMFAVAFMVLCILVNFVFADSRSSIVAMLLMAFAALFGAKLMIEAPRVTARLCLITIFGVCAFSYYAMMAYTPSSELLHALNDFTSGRLYFGHHFYELTPPKLLGQDLSGLPKTLVFFGERYSYIIDNSYMRFVIIFGIVPTVLAVIGILLLARKVRVERACLFSLMLIAIFAIYAFTEKLPMSFDVCYCALLLMPVIYDYRLGSIESAAPLARNQASERVES